MIPDYVVSREDAKGSAADNNAIASWKDGMWTVVMIRPLGLANPDDKALKEGGVYNVGFAVHDDNITTRGHHVSFVKTLGLGASPRPTSRPSSCPDRRCPAMEGLPFAAGLFLLPSFAGWCLPGVGGITLPRPMQLLTSIPRLGGVQ